MKLIMLCVAGSHLYGTNRPDSDLDLRGVVIEDAEDVIGLGSFEQMEGTTALKFLKNKYKYNYPEGTDITLYGLRKFAKLAADGNPNIIELMFADNINETDEWNFLMTERHSFLSKKFIKKFIGYVKSQHNGVRSRKNWIDNPPTKPNPYDYGMDDAVGVGVVWVGGKERHDYYSSLLNDYNNYLRWIRERNPARFELERRYGYDTKAAMHIYRLVTECINLIVKGRIVFPLHNVEALREVLVGKLTLDEINEFMKDSIQEIERLGDNSPNLKDNPDIDRINEMLKTIYLVNWEKDKLWL